MDLLRFITAGSVDDGKSTLIGRLLYDSKSIMVDQLEAIEKQTKNKTAGDIDLALLTDGLRAEREQGITIDVAYKYFSTPQRKFIIADAPGHIQYTRNMVTGASNSDLIIILVDARNGVVEQTRRHSLIASLLKIPHVVVAVNKMDLVNYSQDVYNNIVIDFAKVAKTIGLKDVTYIPMSAVNGDNIVEPLVNAIEALQKETVYDEIIFLTPDGKTFDQPMANKLSLQKNLLMICGHYKGIDQRVRDHFITMEVSIGDYVLSGGELAAAVMTDAIGRLIPGVLNDETSALSDSFQDNLLAPPVYTRPEVFRGWEVPKVLMSGNHKLIDEWRHEQAVKRTEERRPDLSDKSS